MGIKVLAPDVNESDADYTPRGVDIRFGLAAVRNVGEGVVASIAATRIKKLADETDSYELWLGTEKANIGAQKLYEKLAPDEVEEFVGYTWNLDD